MLRTAKSQGSTKLRNKSFYEIISILIIIIGIISLSFAYIINNTVIHNTGKIIPENTAKSGYWRDIQDAVDLAASLGVGIVHIPEGTWNFVNVSESWSGAKVIIPAGVSVFGAPTERYPNDSVINWKTVLIMPWDAPSGVIWFKINGNSDPNKPSRFSDIKLVGYRTFDPNSTTKHRGLHVYQVINFRVDHCCFEHTCDKGVYIQGHYCCGVIDHCLFDNPYGTTGLQEADSTVDYGISVQRAYPEYEKDWPDLNDILGKYTNYTVFIEDCVFTKWRSAIAGGRGGFYVVRHCVFEGTLARGEVDSHPTFDWPDNVANRGMECYENVFKNPAAHEGWNGAVELWGGGGVVFNNYVDENYGNFIYIFATGGGGNASFNPYYFIWNNTLESGVNFKYGGSDGVEGVNYFQYALEGYTPYPYPHPLTLT